MFKPMLASTLETDKIERSLLKAPLLISPKLDGIRAVIRDSTVLGRSLKPIPNRHVQSILSNSPIEHYDGELVVGLPTNPTVYTDTYSGVMRIDGVPDFTFWVFDHFEDLSRPYIDRYQALKPTQQVRVLPQKMVKTLDDILEYEAVFLEQGFEGAMLRRLDAPYKVGRATAASLDLMKIKREQDDESLILAIYPAYENQNESFVNELGQTDRSSHQENKVAMEMAGGFELVKDGEVFKCSMGKFSHEHRRWVWQNRDSLVGKAFIKYRYFSYGVKDKPRFPRALGFRDPVDMI